MKSPTATDAKDSMMDLEQLREQISAVDSDIVTLLTKRLQLVEQVSDYKKEQSLPVLDQARERKVLEHIAELAPEALKEQYLSLYALIMQIARIEEYKKIAPFSNLYPLIERARADTPEAFPKFSTIATQGSEGAYQQLAADKLFKHASINFYPNFEDVFSAIENGISDYGVLPIENSTAGSVKRVFDLLDQHKCYIVRTTRLKIDHNLLVKKGTKLEDIKHIYSHEQALAQCSEFLSRHKTIEAHAVKNTAIAAQMIANSSGCDAACIASLACARLYDLEVLAQDIQNNDNNYTRFGCISKKLEIYPGANRTSLMIITQHTPGSLYNVLGIFYALGINIIKLESRPLPKRDFEFMFYFDIDLGPQDEVFPTLLKSLSSSCQEMRYVGSYTEVI